MASEHERREVVLASCFAKRIGAYINHVEVSDAGVPTIRRVFLLQQDDFVPLTGFAENSSLYSIVLAYDEPLLYVNEFTSNVGGLDWSALLRIDLENDSRAVLVNPATLERPENSIRAWITDLLGVNGNGNRLTCVRGYEYLGDDGLNRVSYEVVEVDATSGLLTVLKSLAGPFG